MAAGVHWPAVCRDSSSIISDRIGATLTIFIAKQNLTGGDPWTIHSVLPVALVCPPVCCYKAKLFPGRQTSGRQSYRCLQVPAPTKRREFRKALVEGFQPAMKSVRGNAPLQ